MWPFRTDAETNLLDVRKKLAAAEGGANMTPKGKEFWNALPPEERTSNYTAGADLPPGFQRTPAGEVAYWKGVAAPSDSQMPPGQTPLREIASAGQAPAGTAPISGPPPGSTVHDMLAGANEVKLTRNPDTGEVQEVRKTIHTPVSAKSATPGTPPGQPPAGSPPGPMRIGSTPGSVYDALLGQTPDTRPGFAPGATPGTRQTPTGMPPSTLPPISGPPPGLLTPTAADPFPARTITNEMSATHERRALLQRQAIDDQLRRDQMASQERIAQSQSQALAARYSIPAEARVQSAQINAQAKTDVEEQKTKTALVVQELRNKGQSDVANTYALAGRDKAELAASTDQIVAQMNREGKIEAARILAANRGKIDPMMWMTATPDERDRILKSLPTAGQSTPAPAAAAGTTIMTFTDEASARAAGKSTGDIVMVGGKKYRLN